MVVGACLPLLEGWAAGAEWVPGPPSPVGAGPAAGPEQLLGVSLVTAGPVSPGEWGAGHGPGSPVRGQRDQELLHRRRPPRPAQTTPPITNTTNSTQRKLKLSSVTGWLLTTDPRGLTSILYFRQQQQQYAAAWSAWQAAQQLGSQP